MFGFCLGDVGGRPDAAASVIGVMLFGAVGAGKIQCMVLWAIIKINLLKVEWCLNNGACAAAGCSQLSQVKDQVG